MSVRSRAITPFASPSALTLALALAAACERTPRSRSEATPPEGPRAAPAAPALAPDDDPAAGDDDAPAPPAPAPPAQGQWLRGETLSLRIDEATLLSRLRSGARTAQPPTGHHFLRVRVTVQHRGQNPHRLRAARFWVRDSLGRDVPVARAVQPVFSATSDELLLVAGMQEPFELLFELHDQTEARWLVYSDAATRLVGELAPARAGPAPPAAAPHGKPPARALRSRP